VCLCSKVRFYCENFLPFGAAFYSTKAIGEAYGLGLSQAYDVIVNRYKRKMKIENIGQNKLPNS